MSADELTLSWHLSHCDSDLRLTLFGEVNTNAVDSGTQTFTSEQLSKSLNNYLQQMAGRWDDSPPVRLAVGNQRLDTRNLQAIADGLKGFDLSLAWVETTRRQTAVAAASAGYSVDQTAPEPTLVESTPSLPDPSPLVVKQTLRSGGDIRHNGDVIILGDVNPGSSVVATGDVLIWGTVRGTIHAGADGNQEAVIMILRLEASQLRIAERVARVSQKPSDHQAPEIAYITSEGIRLTPVRQFQQSKISLAK